MRKLISAIKRTVAAAPQPEATVHFHQGQTEHLPEVCHEDACRRPQLQVG